MSILRALYGAWLAFGRAIGWVVSHVILTIIYFAVLTPVALLARFGHDPLRLRGRAEPESYWIDLPHEAFAPDQCEKQS